MPRPNPMDSQIFQRLFTGDNATDILTAFMSDYFSTNRALKVKVTSPEIIQSIIPSIRFKVEGRAQATNKEIEMHILQKEHLGEDFQAYWGKILLDSLQGNKIGNYYYKAYFLDFELFKNREYQNSYYMHSPVSQTESGNMEFFELPKVDKLSVRKARTLWYDQPFLKWLLFLSPNSDPQLLKEAIRLSDGIRAAEEKLQEIGRNMKAGASFGISPEV